MSIKYYTKYILKSFQHEVNCVLFINFLTATVYIKKLLCILNIVYRIKRRFQVWGIYSHFDRSFF